MNCERIETQLIAYLDGRATPAERREVEAHLAECAACRTRADDFLRLWAVLDEAPMREASPGFDARLRQQIASEPRPSAWAWLPSPRLAFALSLLIALSVWISSQPPVPVENAAGPVTSEEEFKMIKDLPVLEDYDVLAGFEALSELPAARAKTKHDREL